MICLIAYDDLESIKDKKVHRFLNNGHKKELKKILDKIFSSLLKADGTIYLASNRDFMFNYFGHKIASGELDYTDIMVFVYYDANTRVVCGYNEDGFLVNFPLGFFEANL